MKKIYNNRVFKKIGIRVLITMVALTASCKKFTDLQPKDSLAVAAVFSSPANVELAMAGVYNTAAVGSYNGTTAGRGYPFGAASIEQSEMRGEDMVNIASFYQITYQATYDATSANNLNMWVNLYQLINQTNTLIDGVHQGVSAGLNATAAAAYEGEARFLRALAHHELLIMYCRPYADGNGSMPGVPYRNIAVNSQASADAAAALGRGTVAQDYVNILADLDYAEANLPATRATNGITRVTKAAAIALKTRIKLHMGDWAGVITEGAKLGTSTGVAPFVSPIGAYKLTATPDGPFTANASNSESMFSIEESAKANPGPNGGLADMFGPSDKAGRGLVCTSPNLYNASYWVSSDTRRTLLQVLQNVTNAKYYFNYKYRDAANLTDYTPIMRYAEVLLNVAEAYARTTALDPHAFALLNAVRNRAVATTDQYTLASFTTGNSLIQGILNERRIEFAGEGRRWEDIHRLALDPTFAPVSGGGIPAKILIGQIDGVGGTSYNIVTRPIIVPSFAALPYAPPTGAGYKFVWPIASTEVAANPVLAAQQNPLY